MINNCIYYYTCIICAKFRCKLECTKHKFTCLLGLENESWIYYKLCDKNDEMVLIFGICNECNRDEKTCIFTHFQMKEFLSDYLDNEIENLEYELMDEDTKFCVLKLQYNKRIKCYIKIENVLYTICF